MLIERGTGGLENEMLVPDVLSKCQQISLNIIMVRNKRARQKNTEVKTVIQTSLVT